MNKTYIVTQLSKDESGLAYLRTFILLSKQMDGSAGLWQS